MRQFCFLLVALALSCSAMVSPVTIADIAGDGAAHQITSAAGTRASWVQFVAPSTNSGIVRIGGSAITTTRGIPIAAGGGMFYPPLPADARDNSSDRRYDLTTVYYLIAVGDKLSISYVP